MILYHGSTIEIKKPQIIRNESGRDFGCAFYTTDIREQAERWAIRKAKVLSRINGRKEKAVVNIYEFDNNADAGLKVKIFSGTSMEWLDMVVECRSDPAYSHGYDIVEGKIADDNVGETVSYVVQGIMRKEDALERLRFEKINNQIAFCTEAAINALRFREAFEIGH